MKADGFFRWVWRLNGLLLLPVVLLALFGVAAIVAEGVGWFAGTRDERGAIRTTAEASGRDGAKRLRLGKFQSVAGTSILWAGLHPDGEWSFTSSGAYFPREAHNFLFYDTATRDGRWLVEGNHRLYLDTDELGKKGCETESKTAALLYLLAERDTNGDGEVSEEDDLSIAVSGPDGRGYQVVLDGVDAIHGWHFDPPARLVVFHAVDGAPRVLEFDLAKRAMLQNQPLALPR